MADWQPIATAPKHMTSGPFLVTNNLKARDAHGNMSHVWLVSMVHEKAGEFCAFKEHGYQKVEFLTHWLQLDLIPTVGKEPDPLLAALRMLAGNAGALRAFEHEVRDAVGNTNWQCLMDAVAAADAAISLATPTAEGVA